MKKILSLLAAVMFVATASAQVVFEEGFENGTFGEVKPWVETSCKIVKGTNDTSYVIEAKNGFYYSLLNFKKGETYKISADVKYLWGDGDATMIMQQIDPKTTKLVDVRSTILPKSKTFKTSEITFKVKNDGYHRVILFPKGCYQIDNLKVEKIIK